MTTLHTRHRTAKRGSNGLWLLSWLLSFLIVLAWGDQLLDFIKDIL